MREGKADDDAAARVRIETLKVNNPDAYDAEIRNPRRVHIAADGLAAGVVFPAPACAKRAGCGGYGVSSSA